MIHLRSGSHSLLTLVPDANGFDPREAAVRDVHTEADVQVEAFQAQTGIRCPDGCGCCCLSPHVEATAADALPLASEIVRRGHADLMIARLRETSGARCVLYSPHPSDESRGRCSMYEWRPTICRLYGFAGRRDRSGRAQFSACPVHAAALPDQIVAARESVARGDIPLPLFAEFSHLIASVCPGADPEPIPINDALRVAIEAVALRVRLQRSGAEPDGHADDSTDTDGDGTRPSPLMPPRLAA